MSAQAGSRPAPWPLRLSVRHASCRPHEVIAQGPSGAHLARRRAYPRTGSGAAKRRTTARVVIYPNDAGAAAPGAVGRTRLFLHRTAAGSRPCVTTSCHRALPRRRSLPPCRGTREGRTRPGTARTTRIGPKITRTCVRRPCRIVVDLSDEGMERLRSIRPIAGRAVSVLSGHVSWNRLRSPARPVAGQDRPGAPPAAG